MAMVQEGLSTRSFPLITEIAPEPFDKILLANPQ